jgi:IclR family transcriptional regulator, pca regulon regulatory protein
VGALSMTFQSQAYPRASFLVKLLPALQEAAEAIRAVI